MQESNGFIDFFRKFFHGVCCNHMHGELTLAFGKHEVFVETKHTPCRVCLCPTCCDHQVCGSDVSMFGTIIQKQGFLLFADVKANQCTIEWKAESCGCGCCCNELN